MDSRNYGSPNAKSHLTIATYTPDITAFEHKGMWFVELDGTPIDVFYTLKGVHQFSNMLRENGYQKSFFIDFDEEDTFEKALDIDEVYTRYRQTVNMSATSLENWSNNDCSRRASLNRSPINRNLNLLRKKKSEWTAADARSANRTISFVERMRGMPKGEPAVQGCPSKRDISLRNWAFNPGSKGLSKSLMRQLFIWEEHDLNEEDQKSLEDWFKNGGWVDISRPKKDGKYPPCGARNQEGPSPKCLPPERAYNLTPAQRDRLVRRKRSAGGRGENVSSDPGEKSTGNIPDNVANPDLYSRVKSEAIRKFKTYPSVYANAWLVREYKKRGGTYKSMPYYNDRDRKAPEDIANPDLWKRAIDAVRKSSEMNGSYTTKMVLDKYEAMGGTYKSLNLIKSVTELDSGDLEIKVIGIPFGGVRPSGGDLVDDVFDKSTDLGIMDRVPSYFDHGRSESWIDSILDEMKSSGVLPEDTEVKGFGRDMIGYAEKGDITDEGVMYRIIVDRRHRYKALLKRLAEEGHLAASSKAVMRFPEAPPSRLKMWHVGSMDLTPSPMNNAARVVIEKSMENQMTEETQTPHEENENAAEKPIEKPEETIAGRVQTAIEKALDADGSAEVPMESESVEEESESEEGLSIVDALARTLALLQQTQSDLKSLQERLNTIEGKVDGVGDAMPAMAGEIAKSLRGFTRKEIVKPVEVLDGEELARQHIQKSADKLVGPSKKNAINGAPGFN